MSNKFYDLYKKENRNRYEKEAFDVLITDLLANNTLGRDKMTTIDSHDMEQNTPTNFIPSMFYVFMYVKDTPEKINGLSFYDVCPMILCTGVTPTNITGINFNFIPNDIRARFLDILTGDFDDFYNNVEHNGKNELVINEKLGSILITEKGVSGIMQYMKAKTDIDLKLCIRTYSRRNIVKSRLIEYDQWKYIPFLSFNDVIRGINLAKIQADVITRNLK